MTGPRYHLAVHGAAGRSARDEPAPGGGCPPLLPVTYEQAVERMEALPRMLLEPDGSFVWSGSQPRPWQIDGVLYDAGGQLGYVELNGDAPSGQLRQLLQALAPPGCASQRSLQVQLVREGVFTDVENALREVDRQINEEGC